MLLKCSTVEVVEFYWQPFYFILYLSPSFSSRFTPASSLLSKTARGLSSIWVRFFCISKILYTFAHKTGRHGHTERHTHTHTFRRWLCLGLGRAGTDDDADGDYCVYASRWGWEGGGGVAGAGDTASRGFAWHLAARLASGNKSNCIQQNCNS